MDAALPHRKPMSTIAARVIGSMLHHVSLLTDDDLHLFNEGTHYDLWRKLGSHVVRNGEVSGTYFAVWAPNAKSVSVFGEFNGWDKESHPLRQRGRSGIWEGTDPGHRGGNAVQVSHPLARGRLRGRQGRSVCLPARDAAGPGVDRLGARLRLERRGVDGLARRAQSARRADVDLRGAHRLVATRSMPIKRAQLGGRAHPTDG